MTTVDLKARATSKSTIISITIDPKYASAVPPMPPKKYEQLKQSIKDDGLHTKLTLNGNYILLDGHHRYKACQEIGRLITEDDIDIKHYDPLKEEKFVQSNNQIRRHLNLFQEAEGLVKLVELEAEEASRRQKAGKKITLNSGELEVYKGQARDIAIKKYGATLSPSTFTRANKIIQCGSEEVKQRLRENKTKINTEYSKIQKQEKKQKLLAEAYNIAKLPDGVKLIHADFTQIGEEEIPSNSIPLIFVDPPYAEEYLPLYKELGKLAMRVLQDGGSLVTYLGEGYLDIVIEYLKASGLKQWNPIHVVLTGNHSAIHFRKVFQKCKTLLWFVKGDKLREGIPVDGYMPNLIYSTPPEKLLHNKGWGQSTTEAEFVIKYLTFENEMVLDPMMGEGTTGKAAIKLRRQFLGVDIDEQEYENADKNIRSFQEKLRQKQEESSQ